MQNYQFNQSLKHIRKQLLTHQLTAQDGMSAIYEFLNSFEVNTRLFNRINDVLIRPSTELTIDDNGNFISHQHLINIDDVNDIIAECMYQM